MQRVVRSSSLILRNPGQALLPKARVFSVPHSHKLTLRFYARQSARRTTTETQTREEQRQTGVQGWQETPNQEQSQAQQQYYQQYESPETDETTEQALTPDTRRFLAKVYGTMMAGFGLAAGGAVVGAVAPGLAFPAILGSFGGILGIAFTDPSRTTLRQNLFLGTAALIGCSIGPLLAASAPGVVFAAALGTSAIFGGFTLMALKAKRRAMLMLGGPLLGGLLFLIATSLASLVLPMLGVTSPALLGALYNIRLYGGLGLFSLYIAYDNSSYDRRLQSRCHRSHWTCTQYVYKSH